MWLSPDLERLVLLEGQRSLNLNIPAMYLRSMQHCRLHAALREVKTEGEVESTERPAAVLAGRSEGSESARREASLPESPVSASAVGPCCPGGVVPPLRPGAADGAGGEVGGSFGDARAHRPVL